MMTKGQILNYLQLLGDELALKNLEGEILLAGGASMCLVHDARDMTKDIDALYEPKAIIDGIAAGISEQYGLPANWLNDGVKGFIGANAPKEDYMALNGLRIQTVSAEYLLSMKLISARQGETDYDDIRYLLNRLCVTTAGQAYEILEKYFGASAILPKTMYVIESMLSE